MKSNVRISDGWIWSAVTAISFLAMLCAKLFAGWTISWWIVTLPLWIMPALVIGTIVLCLAVCLVELVGVGVFTTAASALWWALGKKVDYDDYD